ncbi:S66 peptidase family protein [Synechococcus sp. CCY9202]|uniref:S66 peptidase family protein n=1 Tax=Synechococcus sp. CCY9202 TaxID=174698 RepID=UPI002B36DE85|nr:LD-carboxypeptidase [Synechococcus sp. CCY9202]
MTLHRRSFLAALAGAGGVGMAAAVRAAGVGPADALSQGPAGQAPALPMPPPLTAGSRLVAIAPGTWWEDPESEQTSLEARIASAGWELLVPPATRLRWHWFSGTDRQRCLAWEQAIGDQRAEGVLAVTAGWGSARLLESGWQPPPRPIWLMGFSDASALLLAQCAAGLGGAIHGGLHGDAGQWQRLVHLLRRQPVDPLQGQGWRSGITEGPLVVTNLTVATHLIGTAWLPDLRGRIVVFEDVGEAPYRVDRMLTQWRSAGLLAGVAGIGLGRFQWTPDDVMPGDLSMEEVLRERLGDLGIPLVGRLPVGHGRPNLALPLGHRARLDGGAGTLALL